MSDSFLPLRGIRVVSIEHAVAAPICSRHLADLGAEVIKIERPGVGDFARQYDSSVFGESSHFVWLNYAKRSIALDLKHPTGAAILRMLLDTADIFVSNLGPGSSERIISQRELREKFPRLIYCRISGYGSSGPFSSKKAFDLIVQGEAGITLNTGSKEFPAKPGVSIADLACGLYAFSAVNAALVERVQTGTGRHVEISMFDAVIEWMSPLLLMQRYAGSVPEPMGMSHATITPYGPYKTRDGSVINIAVQNDGQWLRLSSDVLGLDELSLEAGLQTIEGRLQNRGMLESVLASRIADLSREKLTAELDLAGIPWGDLNSAAGVIDHIQLDARGRWVEVETPLGNKARVVLAPFLSEADWNRQTTRRVPLLGEHTEFYLTEVGFSAAEIDAIVLEGIAMVPSPAQFRK